MKLIDLKGKRFNRLLVIVRVENRGKHPAWLCACDCGNHTVSTSSNLKRGVSKSCGCLAKELKIKKFSTHGMSSSVEFNTWIRMKTRCYNKNNAKYHRYGGRGIKICDRWEDSFVNFYSDMGPRPSELHSIDREDNNGDYSPDNCRWAILEEQANNTRTNRILELNGEKMTMANWARKISISADTIWARLNLGWSVKKTLTTPLLRPRK